MIRLLSRNHPAANPSPPLPLCPAAGQRERGGEGLAEAQLPHICQDGVSPFAPGTNFGSAVSRSALRGVATKFFFFGGGTDSWALKPTYPQNSISLRISATLGILKMSENAKFAYLCV